MADANHNKQVEAERKALRNRLSSFYRSFNREKFEKCYEFIDPELRDRGRVEKHKYTTSLSDFLAYYGTMTTVWTKIEIYYEIETRAGVQTFAYPLIVWKDSRNVHHLFRERWVKRGDTWYTRVVGLVSPDRDRGEVIEPTV